MLYTKVKFGAELILKLEEGCNKDAIAHWANKVYYNELNNLENEKLEELILDIGSMCCDPQFEYSSSELEKLAIKLIES